MKQWKPVKGFENYQISTEGEVKNESGKALTPWISNSGYLQLHLFCDGKKRKAYVHRLVADTFIENTHGCKEVNHKDGNKTNNCVSNLEWCTRAENLHHCYYTLFKHVTAVKCVETGVVYPSIHEAARQTGSSRRGIGLCCDGKQKKANRLHWKYA